MTGVTLSSNPDSLRDPLPLALVPVPVGADVDIAALVGEAIEDRERSPAAVLVLVVAVVVVDDDAAEADDGVRPGVLVRDPSAPTVRRKSSALPLPSAVARFVSAVS